MPQQVARFGPNLWEVARGCGLPFQCDDAPSDTIVENIFIPETLWSDMPAVHVGAEWQPVSVAGVRDDICQEHRPVPLLLPGRHLRKWARAAPRHSPGSTPWKQDTGSVMTEYAPEVVGEQTDVDDEVQAEVPGKFRIPFNNFDGIMNESSEISLTRTPRKEFAGTGMKFSKCEMKRIKERAPEVVVPDPVIDDSLLADAQAEAEARAKALMEHAGDDLPELFCHAESLWDDTWSVADEDFTVEASSSATAAEPVPAASPSPLAAAAVASSAAASAAPVLLASDYTIPTKILRASPLPRISAGAECEAASTVVAGEVASSRTDAESTGASEGAEHVACSSEAASETRSWHCVAEVEVQLTPPGAPAGVSAQAKQESGKGTLEAEDCGLEAEALEAVIISEIAANKFPRPPSCVVELLGGPPRQLAFGRPADAGQEADTGIPDLA